MQEKRIKKVSIMFPSETEKRHVKHFDYSKDAFEEGCVPIPHYSIYTNMYGLGEQNQLNGILVGMTQDCDEVWYSSIYRTSRSMDRILEYARSNNVPVIEKWSLSYMADIATIKKFLAMYSLVALGKVQNLPCQEGKAQTEDQETQTENKDETEEHKYWSNVIKGFGTYEKERSRLNMAFMFRLISAAIQFIEDFYKQGLEGQLENILEIKDNGRYVRITEDTIKEATNICRKIMSKYYFADKKTTTNDILTSLSLDTESSKTYKSLNYYMAMAACDFLDSCIY